MRIQSAFSRVLMLSLVVLSVLALAPTAQAVITNHSGVICKNYNAGEVGQIDYLTNGTRSFRSSATQIICPLTRNTSTTNSAFVYIDVRHSSTLTTTCAVYSYNDNGAFLGSASQTWTGSGYHEFAINLTGAGRSTPWSDYSVLCVIPGNASGLIYGVDLSE